MSPGNDTKQPAMVNSIPIRLVESKQKVRSPWESPQEGTKGLKRESFLDNNTEGGKAGK